MSTTINLPWPPSVNTYWRHIVINGSVRVLISKKGREYRKAVVSGMAYGLAQMGGRLAVRIEAYPPDRRRRDLDNMLKAPLDALAYAGVYEDDSQIDGLAIVRGPVFKGGRLVVTLEPMEPAD